MDLIKGLKEEMARQDAKYGEQNHDRFFWNSILGEEFGEACSASIGDDFEQYQKELFSVAAVAIQIILAMKREEEREGSFTQLVYSEKLAHGDPSSIRWLLDQTYTKAINTGTPIVLEMSGEAFQEYHMSLGVNYHADHIRFNGVPIRIRHDLGYRCIRFLVRTNETT